MPIKFSIPDKKTKDKIMSTTGTTGTKIKRSRITTGSDSSKFVSSMTTQASLTHSTEAIHKSAQTLSGGLANVMYAQPMFFSPLHTPQNWQIASKRREIYQWARFYYENEPKVAAGIDFYSQFPMNGFKLSCKDKKILKYFERRLKEIKLDHWLKQISFEFYLLGDVFPFIEYSCSLCGGNGYLPNGKECNHPDGTIKSIRVLNPDWITVHDSPMASGGAVYTLEPNDELKQIVAEKRPAEIYNKLPRGLIESLTTGRPITLSNRCISHIKHQGSSYGVYGTSLIRRLFTYLAYKTKLMTANWIVAERLILPIRVVKIGNDQRPANQSDISDVSSQLAAVANDPNLTLVTHHAFEYDWMGATGKIHNITQELEQIGKEILDGFMLNQAILNGEAAGYSSAQVGIEILIRRLDNWRNTLTEWVEQHILLPIAMMRGFKDEELSKETGDTEWLYPTLEFNDMNLRDKTNERQNYMQLHDKGLLSAQTLLESFGLNYDQEIRRKREEQAFALATGEFLGQQPPGGMGGMGGGMPPLGGGGGGMPPLDLGGGGAPPPGGMPGGDMGLGGGIPPAGGDMGAAGGAPPAGGAVAAAQGVSPQPVFRVERRGKGKSPSEIAKEQQANAPAVTAIPLTSLEQKMMRTLQSMSNTVPYKLFGQYKVQVPGQKVPFVIDFAYPSVGVGLEADGASWHADVESQIRDKDRDQKLASVGWRILRFNEDAIENHMTEVSKIIYSNIVDAAKERSSRLKKAGVDEKMIKEASSLITFENLLEENIKFQRIEMDNGLGHIYLIGI